MLSVSRRWLSQRAAYEQLWRAWGRCARFGRPSSWLETETRPRALCCFLLRRPAAMSVPKASTVASKFVKEYYTKLQNSPETMKLFYNDKVSAGCVPLIC